METARSTLRTIKLALKGWICPLGTQHLSVWPRRAANVDCRSQRIGDQGGGEIRSRSACMNVRLTDLAENR